MGLLSFSNTNHLLCLQTKAFKKHEFTEHAKFTYYDNYLEIRIYRRTDLTCVSETSSANVKTCKVPEERRVDVHFRRIHKAIALYSR